MVWNDVNACFTGISLIVTSICRWVPFNWHLKVKFNISHQAVIYLHSIHHNNNMSCSSLTWAWCSLRPTLQWLEFHFPLWTAMLRQGVRSGTLCGLGFCQTSSCFFFCGVGSFRGQMRYRCPSAVCWPAASIKSRLWFSIEPDRPFNQSLITSTIG